MPMFSHYKMQKAGFLTKWLTFKEYNKARYEIQFPDLCIINDANNIMNDAFKSFFLNQI